MPQVVYRGKSACSKPRPPLGSGQPELAANECVRLCRSFVRKGSAFPKRYLFIARLRLAAAMSRDSNGATEPSYVGNAITKTRLAEYSADRVFVPTFNTD